MSNPAKVKCARTAALPISPLLPPAILLFSRSGVNGLHNPRARSVAGSVVAVSETIERAADIGEILFHDVGIDHRRPNIFMPEKRLHSPDVLSLLQQVRSERVALMPSSA